jgi:hypothetical protein
VTSRPGYRYSRERATRFLPKREKKTEGGDPSKESPNSSAPNCSMYGGLLFLESIGDTGERWMDGESYVSMG